MVISLVVAAVLCPTSAMAEQTLRLPAIFGDHMVLQRDMDVPVWGWAEPGAKVSVAVGDATRTATADTDGKWRIALPAMPAGGPVTVKVVAGDETVTFDDVLVGEVWICSGQSNMAWRLSNTANAAKAIKAANLSRLRLFTVGRKRSPREVQADCAGSWAASTPKLAQGFSAVGFYFGRTLLEDLDVPVGLINSSWGGTPVESWTSRPALDATENGTKWIAQWERWAKEYDPKRTEAKNKKKLAKWEADKAKAKAEGRKAPRKPRLDIDPMVNPWFPCTLYNGMIAPVAGFGLRGAIWYQGESNARNPESYAEVFPAMIADWRKVWELPEMPFYFVQLANYRTKPNWAYLREAQTKTLQLPNTGMAVTVDIGDSTNIHPRNKLDVGQRLARWALAGPYGRDVVRSGPLYKSMAGEGAAIRVRFDYADGLVAKGGPLATFEIAGADKVFHPAKAEIDGETVVVSSDKVAEPVAVRYAWASDPEGCNLFNGVGLPASPFRTDDWPREK